MGMKRFNLYLPDQHLKRFEELSRQTGLPVAELMRRMYDHGFEERNLNQLVPCMSGQLCYSN